MEPKFEEFELFGSILNQTKRKELATTIYTQLKNGTTSSDTPAFEESENFGEAIQKIIADDDLKTVCLNSEELTKNVTSEVLNFVNESKRNLNKIDHPYKTEENLASTFAKRTKINFQNHWKSVKKTIASTYSSNQLDIEFYDKEFKKHQSTGEIANQQSFDALKEHFLEKWTALLDQKRANWEIDMIDKWRKPFAEELYKRLNAVKKLRQLLIPFGSELGRLFNLSTGNWQSIDMSSLEKYSAILEREKAIQELVEMLGRFSLAEKEVEEELISTTQLKHEWKVDRASKSDIIGVKYSDDLGSMLPSETVLLSDKDLQTLFFKRFTEKKLQTYDYHSRTLSIEEEQLQSLEKVERHQGKGPFIICVDTSGSMHGAPETLAKTLCFAILKLALVQSRKCFLISFSTKIETIDLSDLKGSLQKLVDFLSMSFHGGTDANAPLQEALRQLESKEYKNADIIMVSDFIMNSLSPSVRSRISKAKNNKTRFHSVVIGNSMNNSVISEFDNNWHYDPYNPDCLISLIKQMRKL